MRLTFCALLGVVALFGIVSCASRQVLQPSKNEVAVKVEKVADNVTWWAAGEP